MLEVSNPTIMDFPTKISTYRRQTVLASTKFSNVYSAIDLTLKEKCALKVIPVNRDNAKMVDNECSVQSSLSHLYIMPIKSTFDFNNYKIIVLERSVLGDLTHYVRSNPELSIYAVALIMLRTLLGLAYIHTRGIVHCDVKPDNILVFEAQDKSIIPKFIDFGAAKKIKKKQREFLSEQFTLQYCSPEVLLRKPQSYPSDIYSLGLTFYFLITGENLIGVNSREEIASFQKRLTINYTRKCWERYPDSLRHLINGMLTFDTVKRWTLDCCLNSEFFREVLGEALVLEELKISQLQFDGTNLQYLDEAMSTSSNSEHLFNN